MPKYPFFSRLFFFSAALSALVLTACSSGGGGGDAPNPPAAPTLSVAIGLKQLQFSWPAVDTADYYVLKENPDGASGFTQVGSNITGTSHDIDIAVHNHNWQNARYLVEACNADGCSASSEVSSMDGALQAIGYFKASNTDEGDFFGVALALSGDGRTLAASAFSEDSNGTGINSDSQSDNTSSGSGAVYLFRQGDNGWYQQAYIKASNNDLEDSFGGSLALSTDGNTLAVGAVGEDSSSSGIDGAEDDNTLKNSGAVYLFRFNNSQWSQQAYIKASNPGSFNSFGDFFGTSVSLSGDGNRLAVGARLEDSDLTDIHTTFTDNNNSEDSGAVYLFRYDNNLWSQEAYIKASNAMSGDEFGWSLDLSKDGNTLVVGTENEDSIATDSGAVYVFRYQSNNWIQQAHIKASNAASFDYFGTSVSISQDGNVLAVGAPGEDNSNCGINRIDNDQGNFSGAAYIFKYTNSSWSQEAYIKASDCVDDDAFGKGSVALSADGNTLLVGMSGDESSATGIFNGDYTAEISDSTVTYSGAALLFKFQTEWVETTFIKPTKSIVDYAFAENDLDMSDDGAVFAINAEGDANNTTGINSTVENADAPSSGAVYLY